MTSEGLMSYKNCFNRDPARVVHKKRRRPFKSAAKGSTVNLRHPNLWLPIVAAGLMVAGAARAAEGDLSDTNPNSPYRNMLAQAADSGSGISGSDAGSDGAITSSDGSAPQEEAEAKPKKKKARSSWWPFGHKDRDTEARKKKPTKKEEGSDGSSAEVPRGDAAASGPAPGADAAPVERPRSASADREPVRPARESSPAAADAGAEDKETSARLRQLQETLPAEITERARRGESRIADLLNRAQAIKSRQGERDKEAQEEARREEQRAIEHEREARRLRALAAAGQLPEEVDSGLPDDGLAAPSTRGAKSNAEKIKQLQLRKEELIAEGAPQDRLDRLDAQIAGLKKAGKTPKPAKVKPESAPTVAKKPAKAKSSKAAKTGKTAPAKPKKDKVAKAKKPAATDDLAAPPLPMDASPDPAPAGAGEEPAGPPPAPRKKKKAAAAPAAVGLDAPAVPAAGDEFKLESPASAPSTSN